MNDESTVTFIDPETLHTWMAADDVVVVDVREAQEYQIAHIEGSTLIPLSSFDPSVIPPHEGKKLVIHCASGVRCGMASQQLIALGYTGHIHRLAGGLEAWRRAGGPIV